MATRRALGLIYSTVTLDTLALGLMIPVLPGIVRDMMGGDIGATAQIVGLFATVAGGLQIVFSPLLGALSDRWGRRPVLLISCLGLGLDYFLMALAPTIALLFVGRVIAGITAATFQTCYAYIADVTPEEGRAKAFGMVGVGFALGFIVGPAIGGLLGTLDPRLPLWFAGAACLTNAAIGWFILPESLPQERRMTFSWARANPLGTLQLLTRRIELAGLATVGFLGQVAHQVLIAVFVLYVAYRYGWDEGQAGLSLAFSGICSAVVQGLLIGPIVARLGERATMVLGLLSGALGLAIFGLAPAGWIFPLGIPLLAMTGLSGAASLSIMSRLVSPSEQGQLTGANSSLANVAALFGPLLFGAIFAHFLTVLPGAPFLLAAGTLVAAAVTAWAATRRLPPAARPQ